MTDVVATNAQEPAGTRERSDDDARILALLDERTRSTERFFVAEADRIARLCHRAAERFAQGGRLVAIGETPAARSDVRHVAVEFVHPVIVGKRALPAIGVTPETGSLVGQAALLVEPQDIVMAFGDVGDEAAGSDTSLRDAVATARRRGALTIAYSDLGAEWTFVPPSNDPFVRQELAETLYHVVWELVHVFFEHQGLLSVHDDADSATNIHDAGASSFLYPFLGRQETDLESVIADVRQSVVMKAQEVTALRIDTIRAGLTPILDAATILRPAFDAGRSVIAFGNGGSATDAMDAVADLRFPPAGLRGRPALDLTEDAAVLTAIANDIGGDAIFSRQIIAYGRPGDVALTFSTSGNSVNVTQALEEARRRGLSTVAFVGYDGGHIRARNLADVVILSPSQYTPRVQEAQATAWHIVRTLVG